MHAKPDLRVLLKWMIAGSGSVITDVIQLNLRRFALSHNPYAAPLAPVNSVKPSSGSTDQPASRFTRFAAAMVDGILMVGILMPVQYATGYIARAQTLEVSLAEQVGMSLLGLFAFLILNGYLLYSRGQTIGKFLTKIQIVDKTAGDLLPFLRVYVFRYLWTLPFVMLVVLIPGRIDDLLLNAVVLIDVLFIFGAASRCLHDYIAGSSVVQFAENRTKLEN